MSDMSTVLNASINVTLNGKSFKIFKLALEDIFSTFETKVKEEKIRDAQTLAAGLTGKDKVDFLKEIWGNLPSGEVLMDLVNKKIGTLEGIRHLLFLSIKKGNPTVTFEEITGLITEDSLDELSPLIDFICGINKEKKGGGEEEKKANFLQQ